MIEINEIQKTEIGGSVFIEGFPGLGLVGVMAVSYMTQKLEMRYFGYISSPDFPPLITIRGGKAMPPVRIYWSEKNKIAAALADFTIPLDMIREIGTALYDYLKAKGVRKAISIGGIPSEHVTSSETFAIASNGETTKELETAGISTITDGVSTGVGAILLQRAITDQQPLNVINLLVPVEPGIVDPKYAENAVAAINSLLGIRIDLSDLEKEAVEVEAKLQELLKKGRETRASYKKTLEPADSSLYG